MCGIWGFVGRSTAVDVANAWDGLCALTDRGPDDWGYYTDAHGKVNAEPPADAGTVDVFLGNRRLSILDLSAAGNQPMSTADGRYWIVYNGEIYNYRELRETLRDRGYEFRSDCDTEVVLKAAVEFGSDCVERFRGMFAFAVWDSVESELLLARDRLGIKPLYYTDDGDRIAFASEVTSLLDSGVVDRRLDPLGVETFLALGSIPSPQTIVDGVVSLPPATTLHYDATTGETDRERYWEPEFGEEDETSAEAIRSTLAEAVRLRLRSDVPVGAFLSGGLDSSTVVALMRAADDADGNDSNADNDRIRTFSVGFEEGAYSEAEDAAVVAETLGTHHEETTVTPEDVAANLDDIVASMDQPTVDGVNTYFVSQAAADAGLRVAMSGLGSDELFYGYHTFSLVPRLARAGSVAGYLPASVRSATARALDRIDATLPDRPVSEVADILRSDAHFGAAYLAVRGLFTERQRTTLLEHAPETDLAARIEADVTGTLAAAPDGEAVSHAELRWYMHNQLLRDTDAMSMTHSLEVRVPFLDADLVDRVAGTGGSAKAIDEKGLLKRAVASDVPDAVLKREKTGFTFPFADWLREDLAGVVDEALVRDRLERTPLNPEAVWEVRQAYEAGDVHWSRLWSLVVLSLWVDSHVDTD
mgnify:CR=1 FL=1